MPIDDRGFRRRQDASGHGALHNTIFKRWHGKVGYSIRRYAPSLNFLAICLAISSRFGRRLSSFEATLYAGFLPFVRIQMSDARREGPYDVGALLDTFKILMPNVYFVTAYYFVDVAEFIWSKQMIWSSILIGLLSFTIAALLVSRPKPWQQADVSKDQYAYTIPLLDGEIRLLELGRKIPFLRVRAKLLHSRLSDAPSYEAISYRWGSVDKTHTMTISGLPFPVTTATYTALANCSRWWSKRTVWIDYVCIHQEDEDEKSIQVGLMRQIYGAAQKVIVCLAGPPKDPGAYGLLIQLYGLHNIPVAVDMIEELSGLLIYSQLSAPELAQIVKRERHSHRIYRWDALIELLSNPWFGRIWVVQEVAVSSSIEVLYGSHSIDWDSLSTLMFAFREPEIASALVSDGDRTPSLKVQYFRTMARMKRESKALKEWTERDSAWYNATLTTLQQGPRPLPLGLLLTECAGFEATDLRDKVYALLGLTREYLPPSLLPDYRSKSTRDVYMYTARHFLRKESPYTILPHAGIGYREKKAIPDLPSWAIDWSTLIRSTFLSQPFNDDLAIAYRASRSSRPSIRCLSNSDTIAISALILDQIQYLGSVCDLDSSGEHLSFKDTFGTGRDPKQLAAIIDWHDEAYSLASKYGKVDNRRKGVEEAFARTLIGDMSPTSRPAPAVMGEEYRAWIQDARYWDGVCKRSGDMSGLDVDGGGGGSDIWGAAMGYCAVGRRFCITKKGWMGMVPPFSKLSDGVVIILGAGTPYVVRNNHDGEFELVGECYLDGLMDGEGLRGDVDVKELVII